MTTPKRNEAVVRLNIEAFMSIGCPDWKQVADPKGPFVYYDDYAALQGEVSRLREAKDRIQQALNAFEVPKMSESKAEYYKAGARAVIALVNANLEPPTDGR